MDSCCKSSSLSLAPFESSVRSRSDTALEVLALRQQVAALKRKRPRPKLNFWDRIFWTALRECWPRWKDVLILVKPDTVVGCHRAGFRLYWRWRSRPLGGRPKISELLFVGIDSRTLARFTGGILGSAQTRSLTVLPVTRL